MKNLVFKNSCFCMCPELLIPLVPLCFRVLLVLWDWVSLSPLAFTSVSDATVRSLCCLPSSGESLGSALGKLIFTLAAESPLSTFYADNIQHYLAVPSSSPSVLPNISNYLAALSAWMFDRYLKVNMQKTDFIVFSPKPSLSPSLFLLIGKISLPSFSAS